MDCLSADSGQLVPRPLGHVLHGSKQKEVIHFDYAHIGKCRVTEEYVLELICVAATSGFCRRSGYSQLSIEVVIVILHDMDEHQRSRKEFTQ